MLLCWGLAVCTLSRNSAKPRSLVPSLSECSCVVLIWKQLQCLNPHPTLLWPSKQEQELRKSVGEMWATEGFGIKSKVHRGRQEKEKVVNPELRDWLGQEEQLKHSRHCELRFHFHKHLSFKSGGPRSFWKPHSVISHQVRGLSLKSIFELYKGGCGSGAWVFAAIMQDNLHLYQTCVTS